MDLTQDPKVFFIIVIMALEDALELLFCSVSKGPCNSMFASLPFEDHRSV